MPAIDLPTTRTARLDTESQDWMDRLGAHGSQRDTAIAALHALLLKSARYEIARRRIAFPHLRGNDYDDLARQAPTTRSSQSSASSETSAATAASPPGPTNSRCSRPA
jgi:hypothetical protein